MKIEVLTLVHYGPYILYILLIAITIWTSKQIMQTSIKNSIANMRYRYHLRKNRVVKREIPLHKRSKLYKHIYFMLNTVRDKTDSIDVYIFFITSSLIGVMVSVLMFVKFTDLVIALFVGGIAMTVPYMYFQIKLRNLRNSVGNQLTQVVQVLTQSYNASGYDMYEALKLTLKAIKDKDLKQVFVRLLSDLQTSRNETEMRTTIDLFIYTCGNSWAKRLGNIILKSYSTNENVMNTLLTLTSQMENTTKMLEQEKSSSVDAVYNGYLGIALFPLSLFFGNKVVQPQDWVQLQFGEQWAFLIFILALVFTIFSFMMSLLLRKPKNDL